ncbi:MAG: YfiR family protein [Chryseolinea sp.]
MQRILTILICLILMMAIKSSAQTTNYQVYALFVINIAKYSEFPNANGEVEIVTYGKSKAYDELMKQNGKVVNGSTLRVTQSENLADLNHANIIYVPDGKSSSLNEIIMATEGRPVMIICEREGLFKKGAGFSFVITENNTLRFDINNVELEKRQIKISKSLSALANSII